jgi:hypothetical protein
MSHFHAAGEVFGNFVKDFFVWLHWFLQITVVDLLIGIGDGFGIPSCKPHAYGGCTDERFIVGFGIVVASLSMGIMVYLLIDSRCRNKAKVHSHLRGGLPLPLSHLPPKNELNTIFCFG